MPFKTCKSCKTKNGVRATQCSKCKGVFVVKQKKKSIIELDGDFDWKTLKRGTDIKIAQGSGPTFTYHDNDRNEVKECMGHYGWFRVYSLTSEGIHAYEILPAGQGKVKTGGYVFLYMTKKPRVMKSGTVMMAHKIIKVKNYDSDVTNDN